MWSESFVYSHSCGIELIIEQVVAQVHGRAREFFVDTDKLRTVLRLLAIGIDRRDDMVCRVAFVCRIFGLRITIFKILLSGFCQRTEQMFLISENCQTSKHKSILVIIFSL